MSASSSVVAPRRRDDTAKRLVDLKTQGPLIGGFLLLLALAAGSILLFIGSHHYNQSVSRTLQVRSEAYRLLTLIQDAETGQRGYIITGNQDYLRPYEVGAKEAPKALRRLLALVGDHDTQKATVGRLEAAMNGKLRELAGTVTMGTHGDMASAIKRVKDNVGNNLMETVRAEVASIEAEEERTQAAQVRASETTNTLLVVASIAGIAIVILLAGYAIRINRRAHRDLLSAQDALIHTNENLEGLVAERVTELQVANEEIQRFAYIVSHDLRAPLVNVMGFTSELETTGGDIATFLKEVEAQAPNLVTADRRMAIETDLPEALDFIRTSTAKMDRLINAILKLSREGRRVLTPQKVDLAALIEAQGDSLSQQLSASDATLEVEGPLPEIVSDRLAIEQIFGNLIENAVKYLAPGRPGRIAVTGKTHGAYLRYDIEDNGRGIEPKDFERIFELFRRSGEQNTAGEGIGLAYVRNLARRLGGNVSVHSQLGVGSTFTVTLPAVLTTNARSK